MSSQGWTKKYASNRKLEIQLKKELEAVKNKALLERYTKQRGAPGPLPPISPPSRQSREHLGDQIQSGLTFVPKQPPQSQQYKSPTVTTSAARKTRTTLKLPMDHEAPAASTEEHLDRGMVSLKAVKSPCKSRQEGKSSAVGPKQPISQKVVKDTSQRVKFAIVNTQNTSVQVKYAQRQTGKVGGKEEVRDVSKHSTEKKPSKSRHGRDSQAIVERRESRPLSHPTVTDSHTSYQKYVVSQTTEYTNNIDSDITTAANTPAPVVVEEGVAESVSGVEESFQSSKADLSSRGSCEAFQSDDNSSASLSQLGRMSGRAGPQSRLDSTREDSAKVSMTHSGRVTIEVDMRFDSIGDHQGSEPSEHSGLTGKRDHPNMFEVGEETDIDASQPDTLSQDVDSEMFDDKLDGSPGPFLQSGSALSIGSSNAAESDYQQSDAGYFLEGGDEVKEHESDLELLSAKVFPDPVEQALQSYNVTMSQSSISCHSDTEYQPRSDPALASLNGKHDSVDREVPISNAELPSAIDKDTDSMASSQLMNEVSFMDEPKGNVMYPSLSDDSTMQPPGAQTASQTVPASTLSSPKLSTPCTSSLSSVGMPPSHDPTSTTTCSSQYLTPSAQSVTSQPRTSLGSVHSSVHSMNIHQSSHLFDGLPPLLTSSRAETSSWLLAHHSVSKMKEDELQPPSDSGEVDSSHARMNDMESGITRVESEPPLTIESQSHWPDYSGVSSREGSSIGMASTRSIDVSDSTAQGVGPVQVGGDVVAETTDFESVGKFSFVREDFLSEKASDSVEGALDVRDGDAGSPSSLKLAEYLAFSSEPVTLEDVMHISGEAIPVPVGGQHKAPSLGKQEKAGEPRVRFLSTWESSKGGIQSVHRSIHHFCTEPSLPQLPIHLQVASRQAHANPLESSTRRRYQSGDDRTKQQLAVNQEASDDRGLHSSETCPPPNSPRTTTKHKALAIKRPATDVYQSEVNSKSTTKVVSTPILPASEGRPSTVALKSSVQIDENDDDIVKMAKSKLMKELREGGVDGNEAKPSTAKLSERRVKWKERKHVTGQGEGVLLSGSRMKVAQDPSSLLWVPAPPKLSLHPSTVQTHLFPDYHSTATPTSLLMSSWQPTAALKRGTMEQGDNATSNGQHKKLLPLSFSSVKDMSLLSKPKPDIVVDVPRAELLRPSIDESSVISSVKTPTSPSMSTMSGSEKGGVDTVQRDAVHPIDIQREALLRRRHTIFVSSDGRGKPASLLREVEEEREEREGITIETSDVTTKSDDLVRKTQSLPLIADSVRSDNSLQSQTVPVGSEFAGSSRAGEEYMGVMEEVRKQREQLLAFHKRQSEEEMNEELETNAEEDGSITEDTQPLEGSMHMLATSGAFTSRKLQRQAMRGGRRVGGGGTGRKTTGRVRALRRTRSAQMRSQEARETLSQPPKKLTRTTSFPLLKNELIINTIPEPSNDYRRSRRGSLPSLLTDANFQALRHHIDTTHPIATATTTQTYKAGSTGASNSGERDSAPSSYEWALKLWWDRWFPDVLQEYKEIVASYSMGRNLLTLGVGGGRGRGYIGGVYKIKSDTRKKEKEKPGSVRELEPEPPQIVRLANIDPPSSLTAEEVQQIESEVSNLTKSMSTCQDDGIRAVFLCRRGALLRKIGSLRDSMTDLKTALSLQPSLSDALWHRHLLYLIQGDEQLALNDLNTLLKCNKKHFGAFRSRATLVLRQGDTSKAIFNLSQAIALQPKDAKLYFMKAELHEKRGEIESALSGYGKVSELQPSNKEAISRQAMHNFRKGMWGAATQHFNTLLQLDPNNTQARIHRAQAQYNLGRYVEALQDVSAAIHLDPNDSQAFYHRACLLRKSQPKQALRDLSVSLLLDDSVANVSAHLHRGILYTQMDSFNEALCDFEAAVKLQHSLPLPHVCAGLIHMLQKKNLPRAVRCFSTAISVDPTCTRAYLCRAEAYKTSEMYDHAILDCARLIHIEPNNPTYYLRKGELHLLLKDFKMAALHIQMAAKLCHSGFNQSKTQQALVESFLGHHLEAVALLKTMLRSPSVFTLMGKIQFKAKRFDEAAASFREAIALVERSLQPKYMVAQMSELDLPKAAVTRKVRGDIHFQCGRSLVEGGALEEAMEEFSEVLIHCPDNAMAYYERGVAKLKAGGGRGIYDLNRSLAINPKLFQAFLARAAHYGRTGRHAKAILNCNEAIKLVPNSVRAHLCRGALKYQVKLYPGAVEDFNTAISLDPSHAALAYFNRALCYEATGNLQKALSDYSTVLVLEKSPSEYIYKVHVNRGLVHLRLKDYSNALLDFLKAEGVWVEQGSGGHRQAVKETMRDPAIHQAIGYCHHQLGSLESAIEAYSLAIEEDPGFLEAYVGRGNVYMDFLTEEGFEKSKEDYLRVLKLNGAYLPARVNLAFLLQAEGHFKQAWDELTLVLQEDVSFAPALEARSIISLQMGNTFGALLDISNALKVVQSAALLTNRGVIHQFTGDSVSAMRDYQKAVDLEPDYSLAHFNIGNILFTQRHFKQAITSYTKALSSCQDDTVLLNRAIAYSILGDTEQAMADFDLAIELNPHSAPSYFNRGNLHSSLGNYSKAGEDYKKALELQPGDWLTMYYYGEVLGREKRLDESKDMFRQAAETELP